MKNTNNVHIPAISDATASTPAIGRLLTIPEAAEILRLSIPAVRSKLARHEIGYCKLSHRGVRLPTAEIERWTTGRFVPARSRTRPVE